MELTKRVVLVALAASGGALERPTAAGPGDAQAPCCAMTPVDQRGFSWN